MDYNDLNFKIYKKDGDVNDKKDQNRVLGFLVNTILKANNNKDQKSFRYGYIDYDRNSKSGFFAVIWKSVATGIAETVSGDGNKERKARAWMKENGYTLP